MELYLKGALVTKKLHTMVLDEADRMMDMGFMPQLRDILEVIPRKRQNLLFSATFPQRVERLADEFLLWPTRIEVTPEGTPVASVDQYVVRVPNVQTKINAVLHWLLDSHPDSRALLFVSTKEDAKRVRQALEEALPNQVAEIHSNKAQHTRLAAMAQFRAGDVRVLVSTDVSARGIDVPETEVVINFNVPPCLTITSTASGVQDAQTAKAWHTPWWTRQMKWPCRASWSDCLWMDVLMTWSCPHKWNAWKPLRGKRKPWPAPSISKSAKADPTYKGAFHEKKKKNRRKSELREQASQTSLNRHLPTAPHGLRPTDTLRRNT